jgi:hypothetical protein
MVVPKEEFQQEHYHKHDATVAQPLRDSLANARALISTKLIRVPPQISHKETWCLNP